MRAPLPVTVVTGFLGAGKTTLINGWLRGAQSGDVAVIVNELGDVGIDGELLAARARELVEIAGGCVCCTNQGELVRALEAFAAAEERPRRVLVETSGAASPAGVLRAVAAVARRGELALDGVVTVVDATRAAAVLEHDLALEQLGFADVVVLSRSELCAERALGEVEALVRGASEAAVQVHAVRGVAPSAASVDDLLSLRAGWSFRARVEPVAGGQHAYESVSLELDGELDGDRFAEFVELELGRCAGRIFRVKGILALAGLPARMVVQGVGGEVEVEFGATWGDEPRRSRLVVIGYGLDRSGLERGFGACCASLDPSLGR